MKKQLLSALILLALPVAVSAAAEESASDTFHSHVPAVNKIEVLHTTLGQNDRIENLGSADLSNKEILRYTISNNDPAGFSVKVESANKGKMIRNGGGSVNTGDYLDYTVTTQETDNASVAKFLGSSEPTQLKESSLKSAQTMAYDTGLESATVDYTYKLGISASKKPELFRGMFQDTITITIADNS